MPFSFPTCTEPPSPQIRGTMLAAPLRFTSSLPLLAPFMLSSLAAAAFSPSAPLWLLSPSCPHPKYATVLQSPSMQSTVLPCEPVPARPRCGGECWWAVPSQWGGWGSARPHTSARSWQGRGLLVSCSGFFFFGINIAISLWTWTSNGRKKTSDFVLVNYSSSDGCLFNISCLSGSPHAHCASALPPRNP